MARLNVNPTRMVLTGLKKRLKVARRGHKLLKDKRDELMKKFLDIVRENKKVREEVEEMLTKAHSSFVMARAVIPSAYMEEALMYPKQTISIEANKRNIMSVNVPILEFNEESFKTNDIYPYGFASTSGELDGAIATYSELVPHMIKLAEL